VRSNPFIKIAATTALVFTLSSCAGSVAMRTSEADREQTGQFDGMWQVDVQKAAGIQYVGAWQMNCGDMRHKFNITVEDGTISAEDGKGKIKKAYVSNKGRFKLILPIRHKSSESGQSDATMSNGNMQIILRGRLSDKDSVGYITYGVAEVGYGGCTAKTKFKRMALPPKATEV